MSARIIRTSAQSFPNLAPPDHCYRHFPYFSCPIYPNPLAALITSSHIARVAAGALKTLQKQALNGEGSVFVNIDGEALRGYKDWFNPAVEEAGLKDFTWYCLHHTFASRLAVGVSLRTISGIDGAQDDSDDNAVRASGSRAQSSGGRPGGAMLCGACIGKSN